MEMVIPQIASGQAQAQSTGSNQQSKSAGGAVFQKALVQQISNETALNTESAQMGSLVMNIAQPETAAVEGTIVTSTLSELMSIIDGLIEQLQTPPVEDESLKADDELKIVELEAALDQMLALLALMGVPVSAVQQPNKVVVGEEGSFTIEKDASAASIKSSLQDTLIQLQALLQQGTVKHVQQKEPTALIGQQLQALTALLEGESVIAPKSEAKSTPVTQQMFVAQAVPQAEVSSMLQRLSQQVVHPSYVTAVAASGELAAETDSQPMLPDDLALAQLSANTTDPSRGLASLASKAATSYVFADEFANSMTGMIVQKFDLTTLNGVSEAKIMLFPEHLGQVDVRITMQNGLLTAIFQTDTAMAKDMLDNQMSQLRAALQAQGLMVDKLEVSQGQLAAGLSQQHPGQGNGKQQFTNQQSSSGNEKTNESVFETELVEQAAGQGLGYGRAINVKA